MTYDPEAKVSLRIYITVTDSRENGNSLYVANDSQT